MREIALHIMDLVENSLRADAHVIALDVAVRPADDLLRIVIEDDGCGLQVTPEEALNPFYTTKHGKRTGLGLSLFRAAAESTGGQLVLERSGLGTAARPGLKVVVEMGWSHVDRNPLGDLAGTLAALVCTNPEIDFRFGLHFGERDCVASAFDIGAQLGQGRAGGVGVAQRVADIVRRELDLWEKLHPGRTATPAEASSRSRLHREMSMKDDGQVKCACGEEVSEEELLARLDKVLREYRDKPGALIPVLQIAQGIFGYLPEVALKRIALGLDKSYSEVAGVVSFYSFFSTTPRGKHLIRVCLGTACYVRGGKRVLDTLKQKLKIDVGETTADRLFTLEVARCFGACGLAPAIMIDEDVHHRVKPNKLELVLSKYRENGQPVAEHARSA